MFDGAGELGELKDAKFSMRFWCDNDGGQQYRPEATVKVNVSAFPRALAPVKATQSVAAFVVVAPAKKLPKLVAVSLKGPELVGDLNADGKPEAVVVTAPDEAQNCDGQPKNNLTVTLITASPQEALRCCGP